jgi:hypothetical protein
MENNLGDYKCGCNGNCNCIPYFPPVSTVTYPGIGPKGWECPKCGKVHAPWVSSCSCHIPSQINVPTVWPMPVTTTTTVAAPGIKSWYNQQEDVLSNNFMSTSQVSVEKPKEKLPEYDEFNKLNLL